MELDDPFGDLSDMGDDFPELAKLRFRIPFMSDEQSARIAARLRRHAVRTGGGCICYGGAKNRNGYGKLNVRLYGRHCQYYVHRLSYWLSTGKELPEWMEAAHLCIDTPACFHPDHIQAQRKTYNRKDSAYATHVKRAMKAAQQREAA